MVLLSGFWGIVFWCGLAALSYLGIGCAFLQAAGRIGFLSAHKPNFFFLASLSSALYFRFVTLGNLFGL
jgi:hypothetical protein